MGCHIFNRALTHALTHARTRARIRVNLNSRWTGQLPPAPSPPPSSHFLTHTHTLSLWPYDVVVQYTTPPIKASSGARNPCRTGDLAVIIIMQDGDAMGGWSPGSSTNNVIDGKGLCPHAPV